MRVHVGAPIDALDDDLVATAGLPGIVQRPPEAVVHSDGVRTTFGLPQRVET